MPFVYIKSLHGWKLMRATAIRNLQSANVAIARNHLLVCIFNCWNIRLAKCACELFGLLDLVCHVIIVVLFASLLFARFLFKGIFSSPEIKLRTQTHQDSHTRKQRSAK